MRHVGSAAVPDGSGLRARSVEAVASFVPSLGFEPTVAFRGPVDSAVPDGLHEHLVAAVREGLSNAARHAGASQVPVSVTVAEGRVTARVSDDGCGPAEPGTIGGGLQDLSQRAAAAGGTCEAQPGPDGGTVLTWFTAPSEPNPRPVRDHRPPTRVQTRGVSKLQKQRNRGRSDSSKTS